jgi:hypothetical protein
LIGAETGIKTITAVHSQCRSWVNRCVFIQRSGWLLSVVGPIADKFCSAAKGRDVPKATSKFDAHAGLKLQRGQAPSLVGRWSLAGSDTRPPDELTDNRAGQ